MTGKKNFVLLIFLFALVQVSVLRYLSLFGVKPDLFLISVLVASLYFDVEYALLLSLLCGVLKDIFSVGTFGFNTFCLPVLSFLVMKLSRKMAFDNTLVLCAVVFAASVFYGMAGGVFQAYTAPAIPFWTFVRISFLESLYTAAVFPLVFKLIKKTARL